MKEGKETGCGQEINNSERRFCRLDPENRKV